MSKFDEMCEMKETLVKWAKAEFDKGKEEVNAEEMGKVIDMIKDLAVAEEKCIKACYYEAILKEMGHDEKGDQTYMDRMGYRGGNSSSGRSSSGGSRNQTGSSTSYRSGYDRPLMPSMWREEDPLADMYWLDNARMGYSRRGSQPRNSMGQFKSGYTDDRMMDDMDDRYGKAYNEYKMSKRHYTETKSPADKEEMDRHANEHMMDTIATIREIYKSADPELRTRMKGDLTKLIGEMPN